MKLAENTQRLQSSSKMKEAAHYTDLSGTDKRSM